MKNGSEYDFNNTIIIEQHASIISKGTTGLHIWPACYFLVEFLKENKSLFENKLVLKVFRNFLKSDKPKICL